MPKTYEMYVCGHLLMIYLHDDNITILQHLPRFTCPECDSPNCYRHCDASCSDGATENDSELVARAAYNSGITVIELLAAAHAKTQVNVSSGAYIIGMHQMMEELKGAFDASTVLPSPNAEARGVQG